MTNISQGVKVYLITPAQRMMAAIRNGADAFFVRVKYVLPKHMLYTVEHRSLKRSREKKQKDARTCLY